MKRAILLVRVPCGRAIRHMARLAWTFSRHLSGSRRRFALSLVVRSIERGDGSRVFAIRRPILGTPFHW